MNPIDMGRNISDMAWVIPWILHPALESFQIDMDIKWNTGDIAIS